MQMQTWLKCRVSPGLFSVEYMVQGEAFDGTGFSLFVPVESVEVECEPRGDEAVDGWMCVEVVAQKGQLTLIRLPRHTLENGQYVTVNTLQLQARRSKQEA